MIDRFDRPAMRLAIREEGRWWVAYIAKQHTMEGALEIARVAMGAITQDPETKDRFMELCKRIVEMALAASNVKIDQWLEPQTAPERERSGHA